MTKHWANRKSARAFRGWAEALACAALLAALAPARAAAAPEPASCHTVRLADGGWTDVAATTALTSHLLRGLGYEAQNTLLSVPVTFAAMKDRNIDVYLGNWMPVQTHARQSYIDDGSIEVVRVNLRGAKYSLAVPAYSFAAGLRDFADIARFAAALNYTIYGIEAGSDGNRSILMMIKRNAFGLGAFHLIDSSEQGMLAQVAHAYAAHAPIVFLGWEPHPMNMQFELRYLSGGDAIFGPNYGGATVLTLVRGGYLGQCPRVGRLLKNLEFTIREESELMQLIITEHATPEAAASAWLAAHPATVDQWLRGVHDRGERAAAPPAAAAPGLAQRFELSLTAHKLPVGDAVAAGIEQVKSHGATLFRALSAGLGGATTAVYALLRSLPPLLIVIAAALLGFRMQRSWGLALFVAAALLLIMNQGYWQATLETLALVLVAALIASAVGVPLGIAAAHRPALAALLRPVLDLMQTLPTFVYLIPTLVLFGLGVVPALISTVIFALPAPIRLTQLGISQVPRPLLEAGQAFGATRWQLLYMVELPSAAPLILAGVTQCIMLSLSMVVIAALVGAGGLGVPVVRALATVQVGMGLEAGLAIVLVAVILDRITRIRARGPPP